MTGTTAEQYTQQGQTEGVSTEAAALKSAQLLFGILSAGADDRHHCKQQRQQGQTEDVQYRSWTT
jgi:hypothetical protein